MRIYLAKLPFGHLALDEEGRVVTIRLAPRDPKLALALFLSEPKLDLPRDAEVISGEKAYEFVRRFARRIALEHEFVRSDPEYNAFLTEFGILLAKSRMKDFLTRDKFVVRAVSLLDSLRSVVNTLYEHLREWFIIHYPECELRGKELAEAILTHGRRENFPGFKGSSGIELESKDVEVLTRLASLALELEKEMERMKRYVEDLVRELAPNASSLIEPFVLAKLIAKAGSLEKLARAPSSTIQLLGAEKALFRHLRTKRAKPPKHGIIFESKLIRGSPRELRGKIARVLASKLSIALKIDFYSGRDESARLRDELARELAEIGVKVRS